MQETLPLDCIHCIFGYLVCEDYIHFAAASKFFRAAADVHRNYLRTNRTLGEYLDAFVPYSPALVNAKVVRSIKINYTPTGRTRWMLPRPVDSVPHIITTEISTFGSSPADILSSYDDLPAKSKIPGIDSLSDLVLLIRTSVEMLTGCPLMIAGDPSEQPTIHMTAYFDAVFTLVVKRVPTGVLPDRLPPQTIRYMRPFQWNSISSGIQAVELGDVIVRLVNLITR